MTITANYTPMAYIVKFSLLGEWRSQGFWQESLTRMPNVCSRAKRVRLPPVMEIGEQAEGWQCSLDEGKGAMKFRIGDCSHPAKCFGEPDWRVPQ